MNLPPAPDAAGADPLWDGDRYRFARWVPSPNFGARPAGVQIDLIVVHAISLPPGNNDPTHVLQLFTNTLDWDARPYFQTIRGLQVSSHFVIGRGGELWQCVGCDDRAWHAGVSHWRGRDNCNDDSIGIELIGLEGGPFEDAQYDTLAALCAALAARHPVAHIAGHEHIAPGRKNDPGAGFDWPRLQAITGWAPECFPGADPS